MSNTTPKIYPLTPAQMQAVEPDDNIWLSASAGTGKTQVLTARVIRLLLSGNVRPENILCITFTKAGAAEMAERINQLLASWVQKNGALLAHDLKAIGADYSTTAIDLARQLFARVLDAPGGGLQILTIHSLCQSLLASFPEEAGMVPGFKPVEGREQDELHRIALTEMLLNAEATGDEMLLIKLQQMSVDMGEERALAFLKKCAANSAAMAGLRAGHDGILYARQLSGVTFEGTVADFLESACLDSVIDRGSIETVAKLNRVWGTKTGIERADKINLWLSLDIKQRCEQFALLHSCWSTGQGDFAKVMPKDDSYAHIALELYQWSKSINQQVLQAGYADRLASAWAVGKSYAEYYSEAKHSRGLVDFDDMISKTATLLQTSNMADWVRYKLDRQIDHILIDEAQDTNAAQWAILQSLSDDFFSGLAGKGDKIRTIFSVGDYKQAIFGFQGTDPAQYALAGEIYAEKIAQSGADLQHLQLSQSFRSTKPVLDFVNAVIAQSGAASLGINTDIEDHVSQKRNVGMIELFAPVIATGDADDDSNEEQWLSTEKRILSHRIANYVRKLLDEKPILETTGKPMVAGDIMILLRSRSDLASNLVSRLHAVGVAVAGIDRLKLQFPIAVQDMMSAIRFVLQPGDDLSLGCLLVSPLIGWDHEKLLQYGYREPDNKKSLWRHLRDQSLIAADIDPLRELLAIADFGTPYQFLENILSGPLKGRQKFVGRLGQEALVPIEELLNLAFQFQQSQGGGLQTFLAWFERGETEIKRENIVSSNEVRVMTVHGSKGLEAPVVILADITSDPTKKPDNSAEIQDKEGQRVPMLGINKDVRYGVLEAISDIQKAREQKEHLRLAYVAITRAQERLVMTGSLGSRSKAEPEQSWYPVFLAAMERLGCSWKEEAPWGQVMRYIGSDSAKMGVQTSRKKQAERSVSLPKWITEPAPLERSPPRPLVPSRLDDDDYGEAPAPPRAQLAAEKGRLIHALFERLSGGDLDAQMVRAKLWLQTNNRNASIDNEEILAKVSAVANNPDYAMFFGTNARAEMPLAGVVGETVITGRIDRMVIAPDSIEILDFKTGRNIPATAKQVPTAYIKQMAYYVAVLEQIFTGRKVNASLLFTHQPRIMPLSAELLNPHKPVC